MGKRHDDDACDAECDAGDDRHTCGEIQSAASRNGRIFDGPWPSEGDRGHSTFHAQPRWRSAVLEREAEGCKDRISLHAASHVELMKPPAADGDLLGPGFECIGEQWPGRHIASSEGTDPVSRAAIIGHLLIIIAADASGEAIGEVLIKRPLEMEFVAASVVGRGVDQIERHAERGGDLGPGLETEESMSSLEAPTPGSGRQDHFRTVDNMAIFPG
jgi:hypothetical protein